MNPTELYSKKLEQLIQQHVPHLHFCISLPTSHSSVTEQNLETFYMTMVSLLEYHFKSLFSNSEEAKKKHVLFVCLGGSHLYQTSLHDTPCNDFDFWTVFQKDFSQQISLPSTHTTSNSVLTYQYNSLDYTCYEVDKFCEMLLQANPFALEILFSIPFAIDQVEKNTISSTDSQFGMFLWDSDWTPLVLMRERFVTKKLVSKYLGYGKSQLVTAVKEKDASNPHYVKSLYHAIRCALECVHILQHGKLCMQWKDKQPESYQLLMQIRTQELKMESCKSKFNDLSKQVEELLSKSKLKEDITDQDKKDLNEWVIKFRTKQFFHKNVY